MKTAVVFLGVTIWLFFMLKEDDNFYNVEVILYGVLVFAFAGFIETMFSSKVHLMGFNEFVEEAVKLIALMVFIKMNGTSAFKSRMLNGGMLGLAFATLETGLLLYHNNDSMRLLIFRMLLTTPMHIFAGLIMGYYVVTKVRAFSFRSLAIPFVFHFAFNYAIDRGNILMVIAVVIVMLFVMQSRVTAIKEKEREAILRQPLDFINATNFPLF